MDFQISQEVEFRQGSEWHPARVIGVKAHVRLLDVELESGSVVSNVSFESVRPSTGRARLSGLATPSRLTAAEENMRRALLRAKAFATLENAGLPVPPNYLSPASGLSRITSECEKFLRLGGSLEEFLTLFGDDNAEEQEACLAALTARLEGI